MESEALPPDVKALDSLTLNPEYDQTTPHVEFGKEIQDAVFKAIDAVDDDMRELSKAIHDEPELAFKEYSARKHLVKSLADLGFTVTNPSSLPTAFVATYTHGTGGRVFGLNAEYDALPGVGHACGHNLIAIIAVAAAAGLRAALRDQDIPGTIKVIGSPAEEAGGGKVILLREGVYDTLDACAMSHPEGGQGLPFDGSVNTGGPASLAVAGFSVEFKGRNAHAGAAPWLGVNALDAAVQGYNAVSMMRQQLEPTMRVHGIIQGSETWVPNIIPDYSKVTFMTRALDVKKTLELKDRTVSCFTAAAKSTGCSCHVDSPDTSVYAELRNNTPLADAYAGLMGEAFGQKLQRDGMTTASTDFGNVCYKCPAIHPTFQIESEGVNHTREFTDAAGSKDAHKRAIKSAKGLAMVGAKFLHDDEFAHAVRKAFLKFKKEYPEPKKGDGKQVAITHPAAW